MKINWIGPYKPVPDRSGADLRSFHLMKELSRRGAEIHGYFLGSHGKEVDPFLTSEVVVDRSRIMGILRSVRDRIGGVPLTVGRYQTPELNRRVNFNRLSYVDHLHLTSTLPDERDVSFWLDEHNLEYRLWEQYAKLREGLPGCLIRQEADCLRNYELNQIMKSRGTGLPVAIDRNDFRGDRVSPSITGKIRTIPNGVSEEWLKYGEARLEESFQRPRSFGFIGEYDWFPNKVGVDQFLKEVWKEFAETYSGTTLYLAGKHPIKSWSDYPSVKTMGYVESPDKFYDEIDALVIPLRHGAGTRLKALEAAARGVPIVSTEKGTEGLNLSDRFHSPDISGLRTSLERALNLPDELGEVREDNHKRVSENYRWKSIGETLWESLRELVVQ